MPRPYGKWTGRALLTGSWAESLTRAGPLTDATAGPVDQDVLARLNLRPVFVGIERDLIDAAIEGETKTVRERLPPARTMNSRVPIIQADG